MLSWFYHRTVSRFPELDHSSSVQAIKRAYAAVRQTWTNRAYARALAGSLLYRLPGGRSVRRALAVVHQLFTNRAYARAATSLALDRLPGGWGTDLKRTYHMWEERQRRAKENAAHRPFIENYVLNNSQLQAFARIVDALELVVPPDRLLTELKRRMMLSEWQSFVSLLDFCARDDTHYLVGNVKLVSPADLEPKVYSSRRRRNILFITGEFPNRTHGGGARILDFIKIMSRDNDIYVYSWFDGRENSEAYQELAVWCKRIAQVHFQEFENSRVRLKEFIGDVPMDIVHYEWHRSLTNYDPGWGIHHIFTYMEAVSLRLRMDMSVEPPLSKRWIMTLIELLGALHVEIVSAARADSHIVVTRKDGEFLSRLAPARQFLILNHGVNLEEFCQPDQPPEPHTLVFTGNFSHYPNQDAVRFFFEKIFRGIQAQIPNLKVYLVGANPGQVQRYHDNEHVIVTGAVEDIRPYIQRAAVCIAPLVSGAGLRSKVIQYAALRRACVATSTAATDLLFEDGKDIFISDDPQVFAARVIQLLENPADARKMAESAFDLVRQHYDNRKLVDDLYQVYAKLENLSTLARILATGRAT